MNCSIWAEKNSKIIIGDNVLIGAIVCSILSIVASTVFLSKSKLKCSDYEEAEPESEIIRAIDQINDPNLFEGDEQLDLVLPSRAKPTKIK